MVSWQAAKFCRARRLRLERALSVGVEQEPELVPPSRRHRSIAEAHDPGIFAGKRRGFDHRGEGGGAIAPRRFGELRNEFGIEAKDPRGDGARSEALFDLGKRLRMGLRQGRDLGEIGQRLRQAQAQRLVDRRDPRQRGREAPARNLHVNVPGLSNERQFDLPAYQLNPSALRPKRAKASVVPPTNSQVLACNPGLDKLGSISASDPNRTSRLLRKR